MPSQINLKSTAMKKTIIDVISILFILLFVYAAMNKLLDVEKFQVQIGQSPLLTKIAPIVAWLIPLTEILVALALAFDRSKLLGLYISFGLMVMFTLYIVAILNFSDHIPCACGGVIDKLGWTEHLLFNIGFVILGLVGILLSSPKRRESKNPIVA